MVAFSDVTLNNFYTKENTMEISVKKRVRPVSQAIASDVANPDHAAVSVAETAQGRQALRAMPDVDLARVSELQAAVKNGTLSLDSSVLAKAMMDYYRR